MCGERPGRGCLWWGRRLALAGCVVWVLASASSVWAQLVAQPAGNHSTLVVNPGSGADIRDDDFAAIIGNKLIQNGTSNVIDAKFMFQQCFGGGMLDDLDRSLGNTVKWVGGAASRWDQPSAGQVARSERVSTDPRWVSNPLPPRDFWTLALLNQLQTPPADRPVLNTLNNATADDRVGINAAPPFPRYETGQSIARNGGETIQLKEPNATSYHAILWAGNPNRERHFFDIEDIRTQLIGAWGHPDTNPNVTISVLFGNGMTAPDPSAPGGTVPLPSEWGAMAATRQNLIDVVNGLPLDENEQFLFYASDHGGQSIDIDINRQRPQNILPGQQDVELVALADSVIFGMLNDFDNVPTLTVDYSGVTAADKVSVLLNNVFLGFLDPSTGETEEVFVVPENVLGLSNQLVIDDQDQSVVSVFNKSFYTGGVNNDPPTIPEPAAFFIWVGLGVAGFSTCAWRRRQRPAGRKFS